MSSAPLCVMDKKAWPALRSCDQKACISSASDQLDNDWVSQLPIDILMAIMSHFTMKEAARTSLVSHNWKKLWHYYPILTFEDQDAVTRIEDDNDVVYDERSSFISRVNGVVKQHLGPTIDEFRVTFDLDRSCQSHVDQWLIFAFSKQVKRLEVDLEPVCDTLNYEGYSLPSDCFRPIQMHNNLASVKPTLTSLCLKFVIVTDDVVECLLLTFPFLENLSINDSTNLTSISAPGSSLSLKHLEVCYCRDMKKIDLSVPKLLSFKFLGMPIELHLRNASLLSKVAVGEWFVDFPITSAFDSLSQYCSQLEYLELRISLCPDKMNLGINPSPAMTNLKHLTLLVYAPRIRSLLGWIPLLEASPSLQKLTLKFMAGSNEYARRINHEKCPLKCLKTLEICGFWGYPIDQEFITYVLENAIMLEEVIIDVRHLYTLMTDANAVTCAAELEEKLPRGVKLFIKEIKMPL